MDLWNGFMEWIYGTLLPAQALFGGSEHLGDVVSCPD